MNLKKFYVDRVQVWRDEGQEDRFGGVTEESKKEDFEIPCRIYDVSTSGAQKGLEVKEEGRIFLVRKRLVCDIGTNIKVGDTIKTEGDAFKVIRINTIRTMNRAHHLEVTLGEQDS